MSEWSEVVETRGDYRVKLYLEQGPEEPYDDGQCPLLRIESRYSTSADHVMAPGKHGRPAGHDHRIEYAAARWWDHGYGRETLAKYLRAYYGTTRIVEWSSDNYTYVAYDTAEWRAYVGWTDVGDMPETAVNLNEYQAWCEGEVYGIVVEKRITWTTDDDDFDDKDEWEEIADSACSGYYGYEWAEEAAKEALDGYAPKEAAA